MDVVNNLIRLFSSLHRTAMTLMNAGQNQRLQAQTIISQIDIPSVINRQNLLNSNMSNLGDSFKAIGVVLFETTYLVQQADMMSVKIANDSNFLSQQYYTLVTNLPSLTTLANQAQSSVSNNAVATVNQFCVSFFMTLFR